jgi:cytochrome c peroxidase
VKKAGIITILFALCIGATALIKKPASIGVDNTLNYFSRNTKTFIGSLQQLEIAVKSITQNKTTLQAARQALINCRAHYKKLEFFIEYFFEKRIRIFNGAPVYEVEEPYMEYQSPVGLQVMESILFEQKPENKKKELLEQTSLLLLNAQGLSSYLYGREIKDDAILESIRLQLIRIITLGIAGYDAPQLKTGIAEAAQSMNALKENIEPYTNRCSSEIKNAINHYLSRCIQLLTQSSSFDKFHRLQFLTEAALPLQEELNNLVTELNLNKNSVPILNYKAANIYSKDALNLDALGNKNSESNEAMIALGTKLFFEKGLSGNSKRSCATCHQPQNYFTDGVNKNLAFNEHDKLLRNTPSLLYAAYQHGQFWDARSTSLEGQIENVLVSPAEMNAGKIDFPGLLIGNRYKQLSKEAFGKKADTLSAIKKIATAIAAYECSLPVMTSPFDAYLAGNKKALSANAIQGFNLFMGKAQCGTCHFAPLFNSLLPPTYSRTELESLGMTSSVNFKRPIADKDSGRYGVFPIQFYIGTFKTPTVRNSAKTAPYMHNGAFQTLGQVIEFYNRGGGEGLGLYSPHQTLSNKPLNLTAKEKANLISFLNSLTDKPIVYRENENRKN